MSKRILLILSLVFVVSGVVSAQTARRTVTNLDLEKYRVQREKAEADYRENYAQRGMPSPEDLRKQQEESRQRREELATRLANERQQSEENQLRFQIAEQNARIDYLNSLNNNLINQNNQVYSGGYPVYGGGLILNNGYNNRSRWNRPSFPGRGRYPRGVSNQPTTMVGGGMVYTVPRSSSVPANIGGPRFGRRF